MKTDQPVIVVTGGNRGIGFEKICRQLAERGAQLVLTARSAEAGQGAVGKLAGQELSAEFHRLDSSHRLVMASRKVRA